MRKFLLTAAIAGGLLAITAGNAYAVDYPATAGTLSMSSVTSTGATIAGCGFAAGATVTIQVDSADVGTTLATAEGCISTTVAFSAGAHTVTATGLSSTGGTLTLTATVADPGSTGGLPRTGANSLLVGGIALAMLAVGGLFAVVTRRRAGGRPTAAG